MIDLYTWTTPNGRKVSIMLEELGVEYNVCPVNIDEGEQFEPEFLEVSPNNRIPAIVDRDNGLTLMESGAIMLYLADKYGRFMPSGQEYWRAMEWLMWQMGGLGPMLGQAHHFVKNNPGKSAYSEARYSKENARLYKVLDTRLTGRDFIVGEGAGEYSLVDMACWPWISRFEWQRMNLHDYPALCAWYLRIAERPAVQKGYQVPHFLTEVPMP